MAVSVTCVPASSSAAQPVPLPEVQAIPLPVTVPLPLIVTVSRGFLNVAPAVRLVLIVSVHPRPVPLQEPLHPEKTKPESGVATIVRVEPVSTSVVQVAGGSPVSQSMSSPETLPPSSDESPVFVTVSVAWPGLPPVASNSATISWSASAMFRATVHGSEEQSPLQSENSQPAGSLATVNVTEPVPV